MQLKKEKMREKIRIVTSEVMNNNKSIIADAINFLLYLLNNDHVNEIELMKIR